MEQARRSIHPLVGAAAVSVIVLSLTGVAAITGVLPRSTALQQPASPVAELQAPAVAPVTASTPAPVAEAPAVKRANPKPAEKPARPHREVVARNEAPAPAPVAPLPVAQAPSVPVAPVQAPPPPPAAVAEAPRPAPCIDCGVVENFREIQVKGEGSGIGAVAGGVGGLILGNQIGRGTGRDIATIAGAVGGAFAGNEIEKRTRTKKQYEVSVRMDDGSLRTVTMDAPPVWRAGERVRVRDGHILSI